MKFNSSAAIIVLGLMVCMRSFANEAELIRQVVASLGVLDRMANKPDDFSDDDKATIRVNIENVLRYAPIRQFDPVRTECTVTKEGSCGTWHDNGCLDYNWSRATLNFLWCHDEVDQDIEINRCCANASILTLGTYLVASLAITGAASLVHGIAWISALPFRLCGTLDEVTTSTEINKTLLRSFIQQAAIIVETRSNNYTDFHTDEKALIERLVKQSI